MIFSVRVCLIVSDTCNFVPDESLKSDLTLLNTNPKRYFGTVFILMMRILNLIFVETQS